MYVCPMHPEIRENHPGRCPLCGMNLLPEKKSDQKNPGKSQPDKHAGHNSNSFLLKFWVSLVLTLPVLFFSGILRATLGINTPVFPGSVWIPAVLGTIVFFYGGRVFLNGAVAELRGKQPGMMTLIGLAITAAYSFSIFAVFFGEGETLFWELTTLITVMLLGHYLEMRAVQGAQGALKELSKLLPDIVEVLDGADIYERPLDKLEVGQIVLIRPGGKIPADGIVIDGSSHVNESMITGESRPVEKTVNSDVIAGTINGNGSLTVLVSKIGSDTFLSGVMRLVKEAQSSKSNLQLLSDRAAFYLTLLAIFAGTLTFILWIVAGRDWAFAMERLVSVLVIACPHALGLAIPLVAIISTTLGARNGILVRERQALELARNIDTVLFDKTGTLTMGEVAVQRVWPHGGLEEILHRAASAEAHSEHFIAKAIRKMAKERKIAIHEMTDFSAIPGMGVKGVLNGLQIYLGGPALLEYLKIRLSDAMQKETDEENKKGMTVVYVIEGGKVLGGISLADRIRSESKEAIAQLKEYGIKTAMVTGDSEDVAKWVAEAVGIEQVFARVLPNEKAEKVKTLQIGGAKVAFVGDGINDAPALIQADVGIAIGAGTNVAIESAGIILVNNDPRQIVKIIKLSKKTYSKMLQNLFWATGYNVIALPLAAGVLANQGILLQPAVGAIFMSVSTVIVAVNALIFKSYKLTGLNPQNG